LIEASVKHADGFTSGAPFVYATGEKYGAAMREHKAQLIAAGRDPATYTYGLHHIIFLCKSKDDFERYVDNPLVRWYAATGGRINMNDWAAEGIESVMPLDWHYAFDMCPAGLSRAEVDAVVRRTPREMVRKTFFYGSPADIAADIIPFAKQGATLNLLADISPLMVETDPFENIAQMAEVCRLVKQGCAA
jgi:phthiodiolone/phenolphthiodiolone dimycocerosates ketoreductase